MTGFIWGFILGLLVSGFGVVYMLFLACGGVDPDGRAEADDDFVDWRELGKADDWVWIG